MSPREASVSWKAFSRSTRILTAMITAKVIPGAFGYCWKRFSMVQCLQWRDKIKCGNPRPLPEVSTLP